MKTVETGVRKFVDVIVNVFEFCGLMVLIFSGGAVFVFRWHCDGEACDYAECEDFLHC